MVSCEELLGIKFGVPLAELGFSVSRVFNDTFYKIDVDKYVIASQTEEGDETLRYCGFVWVASDGVAEWIFTGNSQADDWANVRPPDCLLPAPDMTSYRELCEYGRQADPEHFSDYVVRQCQVSFNDFAYYFRKAAPSEGDYPIGIMREVQMVTKHKDPKTIMHYDHAMENLESSPVNTLTWDGDNSGLHR